MQARSAGCRGFDLLDERTGLVIPLLVMYPSGGPERDVQFGPYSQSVAPDGPPESGPFPFVVISHGMGGTGLAYRATAAFLARRGFVVALPDHPGNNRNDNHLADSLANLENRPRHISLIIDWAIDASPFARLLKREIVLIGQTPARTPHDRGRRTLFVLDAVSARDDAPEFPALARSGRL